MRLIVFSSSEMHPKEIETVNQMFDEGLEYFHLRKTKFNAEELENYLERIKQKHHNKIILHSHHSLAKKFNIKGLHLSRTYRKKKYKSKLKLFLLRLRHPLWTLSRSYHGLSKLHENPDRYDYAFLTPVFDSISKENHHSRYNLRTIKTTLATTPGSIIALGGVEPKKFAEVQKAGFAGAALLGAIWKSEDPLSVFREAMDTIDELNDK